MTEDPRLYRPNVGIALFNAQGLVLIARRFRDDGPEIILPGLEWQMPQGGIDADEDPLAAAKRELYEETGVTHADYLGETSDWMSYDFPPYGNLDGIHAISWSAAGMVRAALLWARARHRCRRKTHAG